MDKKQQKVEWFCVFVITVCYWFFIVSVMRKPLWYDELFTWNIARLSPARIWESLGQGVDLNPPLIYFATKISSSIFGDGNWGTRLPSALAMWAIGLAIYSFMRRHASPWTSLGAALLPLAAGIYNWGAEARPYALMVASGAMALLCWQKSVAALERQAADIEYSKNGNSSDHADAVHREKTTALWWLAALSLCLAVGVSSHYYAIFIWVPLIVGEIVRSVVRRKIAWPVWVALAVGLLPLFFYLPLIASSRPYMTTFWSKSMPREDIVQFYRAFLKPAFLPFALTMFALALRTLWVAVKPKTQRETTALQTSPNATTDVTNAGARSANLRRIPLWEIAACVTLALVPTMTTFFALITQRGYTLRYAAIGTVGCYLVLALLVSRGEKVWPHLGKVFALAAVLGVFVAQRNTLREARAVPMQAMATYPLLSAAAPVEKPLPLVVDYPLRFMTAWHHGSPALRERLFYLADTERSVRLIGNDTNDRAMKALRHWSPIRVADFDEFRKKRRAFVLYESGDGLRWLKPQVLRDMGATTQLMKRAGNESLYKVTWPLKKPAAQPQATPKPAAPKVAVG